MMDILKSLLISILLLLTGAIIISVGATDYLKCAEYIAEVTEVRVDPLSGSEYIEICYSIGNEDFHAEFTNAFNNSVGDYVTVLSNIDSKEVYLVEDRAGRALHKVPILIGIFVFLFIAVVLAGIAPDVVIKYSTCSKPTQKA